MKKIIRIALIILFLVMFWVGLSLILHNKGVSLEWSIAAPFCCYIGAVLMIGISKLIVWLLK